MSPSPTGRRCNGRGRLVRELSELQPSALLCAVLSLWGLLCSSPVWAFVFKRRAITAKDTKVHKVPEWSTKAVHGYFCAKLQLVSTCTLSALRDTIKGVPKRPCSL